MLPTGGPVRTTNPQDPYLAELILFCRERAHKLKREHSQDAVATRLGISIFKYVELEQGILRTGPGRADMLRRLADDLGMTDGERISLFILSGHPVAPLRFDQTEDDAAHMRLVRALAYPAVLHDICTNIIGANDAFWRMWPNLKDGDNFVLWVMTQPEARHELVDWHDSWAVLALRLLKTLALETGDARAIELFRLVEHEVRVQVPLGAHSISGVVRYKLDARGQRVGMRFSTYRPQTETPSDRVIQVFEPVG